VVKINPMKKHAAKIKINLIASPKGNLKDCIRIAMKINEIDIRSGTNTDAPNLTHLI
jgi:hypothetical protein